jgi:hypothetical protein
MNTVDAKRVVAAFEKYLKAQEVPIPECIPSGNSRGVCVLCMDERLNPIDAGRKTLRNAGARANKYTGGEGADGELALDINLVLGSSIPGENAVVMVAGHTDCKANTQLFEVLTGTGSGSAARKPSGLELARIPDDLQASLVQALGGHADKEALIESMTKIMALQNMQNLLEYGTAGGTLKERLTEGKIFPVVAVINSKTLAVEVFDWDEKQYRPLPQIIQDAEKQVSHAPADASKSFVVKAGATATTAAEFFGKELQSTIRTAVERIGQMSAPGVANGS